MSETGSSPGDAPSGGPDGVAAAYRYGSALITAQAIAPLVAAARIGPGARILDVGCGGGGAAAAAAEGGAQAWGVDISASQVAEARQRYPAIAFQQGDAASLPFANDSFDAVISNFGMPHFPHPDGFIGEAFRLLRPGGTIAFTAWIDPARQQQSEPGKEPRTDAAFFRFGEAACCRSALAAAGFGTIRIEPVPVVWRPPASDAFIDAVMGGIVRAATLVKAETPAAQAAIREALRARIEAESGAGAFALAMPAIVASARKAGPRGRSGRRAAAGNCDG